MTIVRIRRGLSCGRKNDDWWLHGKRRLAKAHHRLFLGSLAAGLVDDGLLTADGVRSKIRWAPSMLLLIQSPLAPPPASVHRWDQLPPPKFQANLDSQGFVY